MLYKIFIFWLKILAAAIGLYLLFFILLLTGIVEPPKPKPKIPKVKYIPFSTVTPMEKDRIRTTIRWYAYNCDRMTDLKAIGNHYRAYCASNNGKIYKYTIKDSGGKLIVLPH